MAEKKCLICESKCDSRFLGLLPWYCPVCKKRYWEKEVRKKKKPIIIFLILVVIVALIPLSIVKISNHYKILNRQEAERIKLEKEQEEKRIIAEKLKIAKKECFKAYKTLKKIEAILESGVTLQNYSLAVNDARLELNMIIATADKSFTLLFLTQLEEIFHFYQLGKTVWGAIIEGRKSDLGDVCYKIMNGRLIYYSEYREKILGIECLATFAKPYDPEYDIYNCSDKLRQVLWLEASKRIREYEKETL